MKIICKVCDNTYDSSKPVCPYCGNFNSDTSNSWNIDTDDLIIPHNGPVKPGSTNNIRLILLTCVICVSVILCFVLWIVRNHSSSASDPDPVDSSLSTSSADSSCLSKSPEESPLTATVSLTMPESLDNYHKVYFESGDASSILEKVNELYHYEPSRAFDDDTVTSWQEGNKNSDGEGEWLEVHTKEYCQIKYLTLYLGNWRDKNRYDSNNRPTELRIDIGEESVSLTFSDVMKPQYVSFSRPVTANSIRFTIQTVKVGTNKDHDCCISEIRAYEAD